MSAGKFNSNINPRLYHIDWLRIGAALAVFLFHCARFFDTDDWHVKNNETSIILETLVGFLVMWIMPVFIFLAGQSSYYSLEKRNGRQYLVSRFKRLAVPLLFGIFFLVPHQVYLERLTHGQFSGSLFSFWPLYFEGWYGFGGNFAWMGLHLWFLEVLFIYSIILLPAFLLVKHSAVKRILMRLDTHKILPFVILVMAAPLMLFEMSLDPDTIGMREFGGWNLIQYLTLFFYGYLVSSFKGFNDFAIKYRNLTLVLAIIGFLAMEIQPLAQHFSYRGFTAVRAFDMWCWLLVLQGYSARFLNFNHKLRIKLNEIVLPFYILHQSVIIAIGYFIVQSELDPLIKYLLIAIISFICIVLIYQYLVKIWGPIRFLFGMGLRKSS